MMTSMLEKAIEIEGLLRIIRDGNPLPETYKLLKDKTESLASQSATLTECDAKQNSVQENAPNEIPDVDFVMTAPEGATEHPEVDFTSSESSLQPSIIIQEEREAEMPAEQPESSEIDLYLEEEDDILLAFDDINESMTLADEGIQTDTHVEIKQEAIEEKTMTEASAETADEKSGTQKPIKLRAAFSLNDRFLYARELFNGNMRMFDSTISSLEGITDFSIIEEYFYRELEWNPEDANVAGFMERLKGVF